MLQKSENLSVEGKTIRSGVFTFTRRISKRNPCLNMTILKKGRWGKYTTKEDKKLFFYPNEWKKLMELAKDKQKVNFSLQINTGARIEETLNIKVEDIDFGRNNLILKKTKVRARLGEKKPTPRIIPISSEFAKLLKKYARQYNLKEEDYYYRLKSDAINKAIKKLAKQVGRKEWRDFSSHNIRKTFECWLIALGVDGFKTAKHLGHTPQVALNSYISPDIFTNQDKEDIRKLLGDLYSYNERRF